LLNCSRVCFLSVTGRGRKACKITLVNSFHQSLHASSAELPAPSPDALEHSAAVAAFVRDKVAAADGWISFADYMDAVLYAPGLGYYSAGARKFGPAGDFVTAPEISPLFSRCVAGQCAEVLATVGGGTVLEPGAGTGVMAADMLLELERLDALPEEYLLLETSADLRARQAATLAERAAHLFDRVRWLEAAPAKPIRGVIVANEVLDALPVNRFVLVGDEVFEQGVAVAEDGFEFALRPASEALLAAVESIRESTGLGGVDGYTSEVCLRLPAWIDAVAGWLEVGVALMFDYGYPRREYYLPERSTGTLRCYYRHRAHENPFFLPGLQDITAWVDFSFLCDAANAAGFEVGGLTTQANFLLAARIDDYVAQQELDQRGQVEMAHGLRQLLLPGEMGEAVKVIALSRGGCATPTGMFTRDADDFS
jgi:SAM-dependent MidA family methyltransferase